MMKRRIFLSGLKEAWKIHATSMLFGEFCAFPWNKSTYKVKPNGIETNRFPGFVIPTFMTGSNKLSWSESQAQGEFTLPPTTTFLWHQGCRRREVLLNICPMMGLKQSICLVLRDTWCVFYTDNARLSTCRLVLKSVDIFWMSSMASLTTLRP